MKSQDSSQFDQTQLELRSEISKNIPEFLNYYDDITSKIRKYLFDPTREHKWIPIDWKNNQSESFNHLLKIDINWEPKRVIDLVRTLEKIQVSQYNDLKRAVHEEGNFVLAFHMAKKFLISNQNFYKKNEKEKEKIYNKFLQGPRSTPKFIISEDGLFEVPHDSKNTAKKPNQKSSSKSTKALSKKKISKK